MGKADRTTVGGVGQDVPASVDEQRGRHVATAVDRVVSLYRSDTILAELHEDQVRRRLMLARVASIMVLSACSASRGSSGTASSSQAGVAR